MANGLSKTHSAGHLWPISKAGANLMAIVVLGYLRNWCSWSCQSWHEIQGVVSAQWRLWSMLIEPLTPIKTRVPLHGADDPMFQVEVAAFHKKWKPFTDRPLCDPSQPQFVRAVMYKRSRCCLGAYECFQKTYWNNNYSGADSINSVLHLQIWCKICKLNLYLYFFIKVQNIFFKKKWIGHFGLLA
jgi:hypothetical protein